MLRKVMFGLVTVLMLFGCSNEPYDDDYEYEGDDEIVVEQDDDDNSRTIIVEDDDEFEDDEVEFDD
jgi:hypothetical protein